MLGIQHLLAQVTDHPKIPAHRYHAARGRLNKPETHGQFIIGIGRTNVEVDTPGRAHFSGGSGQGLSGTLLVLIDTQFLPVASAPGDAHQIGQFGIGDRDVDAIASIVQLQLHVGDCFQHGDDGRCV